MRYVCKNLENSESTAREGWTETTTSLERYAMRATGRLSASYRAPEGSTRRDRLRGTLRTCLSNSNDGGHCCFCADVLDKECIAQAKQECVKRKREGVAEGKRCSRDGLGQNNVKTFDNEARSPRVAQEANLHGDIGSLTRKSSTPFYWLGTRSLGESPPRPTGAKAGGFRSLCST